MLTGVIFTFLKRNINLSRNSYNRNSFRTQRSLSNYSASVSNILLRRKSLSSYSNNNNRNTYRKCVLSRYPSYFTDFSELKCNNNYNFNQNCDFNSFDNRSTNTKMSCGKNICDDIDTWIFKPKIIHYAFINKSRNRNYLQIVDKNRISDGSDFEIRSFVSEG